MSDIELLAGVLERFLRPHPVPYDPDREKREFFYISDTRLTLDGKIDITWDEAMALLRITDGRIDGPGVAGQADPALYLEGAPDA